MTNKIGVPMTPKKKTKVIKKDVRDGWVINPLTGKEIKIGGKTFHQLLENPKYHLDSGRIKQKMGKIYKADATDQIVHMVLFFENGVKTQVRVRIVYNKNKYTQDSAVRRVFEERYLTNSGIYDSNTQGDSLQDKYQVLDVVDTNDPNIDNNIVYYKMKALSKSYQQFYNHKLELSGETQGNCVLEYIDRVCKLSKTTIEKEFTEVVPNWKEVGISVNAIEEWVTKFKRHISVHAFDPFFKKYYKRVDKDTNSESLVFISNFDHCYGISEKRLRNSWVQSDQIKYEVKHFHQDTYAHEDRYADLVAGKVEGTRIHVPAESINFEMLLWEIVEETQSVPFGIFINKARKVIEFYHPVTSQLYVIAEEYQERKIVCEALFKKYPNHIFKEVVSWSLIGESLFESLHGKMQKSVYTREEQLLNIKYKTTALTYGSDIEDFEGEYGEFDYKKCYLNAVLSLSGDIPIFAISDLMEDYDGSDIRCGEYIVNRLEMNLPHTIPEDYQIMSHQRVRHLLDKKIIQKSDILKMRIASYHMDSSIIVDFAKTALSLFDDRTARNIVIHWVGMMGRNLHWKNRGAITNNRSYVNTLDTLYSKGGELVEIEDGLSTNCRNEFRWKEIGINKDVYAMSYQTSKVLTSDSAPIMRAVYDQAKMMVMDMIADLYEPGKTVIKTVRTDGVCGWNFRKVESKMYREKEVCALKPIVLRRQKPYSSRPMRPWRKLKDVHFENDYMRLDGEKVSLEVGMNYVKEHLLNKSFHMSGDGGVQKSTVIVALMKLYGEGNVNLFTLSHKACSRIRKDLPQSLRKHCKVLAGRERASHRIKCLIIDECSQVAMSIYEHFRYLKDKGVHIVLVGDFCQTPQVDDQNRFFNMQKKRFVRELVDYNIMQKKYIPTCCRNDPALVTFLETFKKSGLLPHPLKPVQATLEMNIVRTNKMKDKINDLLKKPWVVGSHVICKENDNIGGVFNGMRYVIKKFEGKTIRLVDEDGNECFTNHKHKLTEPYADTVHRFQGSKIDEPYNIHEVDLWHTSRNDLVTALGRATKLDHIHLEYTPRFFNWVTEPTGSTAFSPKKKVAYIYRLYDEKQKIEYIGETTRTLEKRKEEHWADGSYPIQQYGKNFQMELIGEVIYKDESTVKEAENKYIILSKTLKFFGDYKNINRDLPEECTEKVVTQLMFLDKRTKPKAKILIIKTKEKEKVRYQLKIEGTKKMKLKGRHRSTDIESLISQGKKHLESIGVTDYVVEKNV